LFDSKVTAIVINSDKVGEGKIDAAMVHPSKNGQDDIDCRIAKVNNISFGLVAIRSKDIGEELDEVMRTIRWLRKEMGDRFSPGAKMPISQSERRRI
jgi:hypothetical protein